MHLQFRKITFEEMEALFHGLPLHIILRGVVQGIRRNPISRGATFREESLEAKFEFSLFSEVERIYLGRGAGASISGTMGDGCKMGATFSSSRSSLKKKAALWA